MLVPSRDASRPTRITWNRRRLCWPDTSSCTRTDTFSSRRADRSPSNRITRLTRDGPAQSPASPARVYWVVASEIRGCEYMNTRLTPWSLSVLTDPGDVLVVFLGPLEERADLDRRPTREGTLAPPLQCLVQVRAFQNDEGDGDGGAKRLKGKGPRSSALTSMNLSWWRRRELNPRPEARRERPLHAQPLLGSRPAASRRGKTASGQPRIDFAAPSGGPERLHPNFATSAEARRVRYPANEAT